MKAEDSARPPGGVEPGRPHELPLDVITGAFPGIFYIAERSGMLVKWNRQLQAVTGLDEQQLRATRLADLFIDGDRARVEAHVRHADQAAHAQLIEASMPGADGAPSTFLLSAASVEPGGHLCGFGIDISARRAQESSLRLRERAMHAARNGILITRCAGQDNLIEYLNPAFERITGYAATEALGRDSRFMAAPGLDEDLRAQLRNAISERRDAGVVFRNLRKDGALFWNELSVTPVQDEQGMVTHYIGIINDVTAIKQRTSHLEHRLNHDPLTGLANRNLLWDRMEQALHTAQRNKTLVAVVLVDLNKFKQINDTFGHEAGDLVLTAVSRRMQNAVRDTDTVARLNGDEFVLILANQPSLRYTTRMIERLRESLSQRVSFDNHEIAVGASLGVSIYPHDADAPLELVKAADLAMYHAKASGRTEAHFYPSNSRASADARRRFETNLVAALDNEEFFLMFQPRLGARDGALLGVQTLLRWRHPEQGVLTPFSFLKQAEENGMARALGHHTLELIMRFMAQLRDAGISGFSVALQVGFRALSEDHYIPNLCERLDQLRLPASMLQLEINESTLLRDPQLMRRITRQMRECEIGLALDNVGDGTTSLSSLPELGASHLKICSGAVTAISPEGDQGALARLLIDIGHTLDMTVVASGVETEAQAQFLREHGCDLLQGSHIGAPLAASNLLNLLQEAPH